MGTTSSSDAQSLGSEPEQSNPIPVDAPPEAATDGGIDEIVEIFLNCGDELLSRGDALPLADSELAPNPEEAPLDNNTVHEDDNFIASSVVEDEAMLLAFSCMSSSGDAPSSELGPVDTTSTPEDRPLDDVKVVTAELLDADVEPAKGMAIYNSFGELVGWLDPAAVHGKCDPPGRRSRFSTGWKCVKRTFRSLLCCCR